VAEKEKYTDVLRQKEREGEREREREHESGRGIERKKEMQRA
jgi:hypothetical protein